MTLRRRRIIWHEVWLPWSKRLDNYAHKPALYLPNHEQRIQTLNQQTQLLNQRVQAIETQDLQTEIDGIKSDLTDFRNVTCPLLRNAKLKEAEKVQVDKACQSVTDKE
jgi:hypothetical protein